MRPTTGFVSLDSIIALLAGDETHDETHIEYAFYCMYVIRSVSGGVYKVV